MAEDAGDSAPSGLLAELIRLEERVRAMIREAESEAARAIAEAEARAAEEADAEDPTLDDALSALEREIESERAMAVAEAAARGDEAIRRLDEIDEARIDSLAELVARRVAEGEEPAS